MTSNQFIPDIILGRDLKSAKGLDAFEMKKVLMGELLHIDSN